MSLINKVLKDLEARERASLDAPDRRVLEDLQAVPEPAPRGPRAMRIALIAGVLVAMFVGVGVGLYARRPAGREPHTVRLPPATPRAVPLATHPGPIAAPARPRKRQVAAAAHPPRPLAPRRAASRALAPIRRPASISLRVAKVSVPRAGSDYRRAVQALQAGHTGQARAALRDALALSPTALQPALLLAALDIQGGRLASARAALRPALQAHPGSVSAVILWAQLDLRQGRPAAAAAALAPIAAAAADKPSYWALLAAAWVAAGRGTRAISAYEAGLARFPRDGALWVGLGVADMKAGHAARARKAWRKAQSCPLSPPLAQFVEERLANAPTAP